MMMKILIQVLRISSREESWASKYEIFIVSRLHGISYFDRERTGAVKFLAGSFQFNVRVGIAMVPCIIMLLGMGFLMILTLSTLNTVPSLVYGAPLMCISVALLG